MLMGRAFAAGIRQALESSMLINSIESCLWIRYA
jgi:hypothetical protein